MGQITALTPQRGRRKRINVFIDESFAFGIAEDEVARAGLSVGTELDANAIEHLRDNDEASRFYNDALRYLSYRPRSSSEVERYLSRRGADPAIITATIERLSRSGLVDDNAFARFWVENREQFSPRGARALQAELRAKGIDQGSIETALEETGEDDDERAYQAGLKRLRSLARLDEDEFRHRMYSFLQRRGFGYETARSATTRLWEERVAGGSE